MSSFSSLVSSTRVAACLGLVAMLIAAPSFGQQKRPKVFECGPGRANQESGKCDCPAGKAERSEVLHILNDTEEHSHCILTYNCNGGKENHAAGSCECLEDYQEQVIGTDVSCVKETKFVLRPLRPSSITDIATLLPEVSIPRDRQPFLDRIEQALLDDPF
jgi:hypothetical protein